MTQTNARSGGPDDTSRPAATLLDATAREALTRLPLMGRIMTICSGAGLTHELIGPAAAVEFGDDGVARIAREGGAFTEIRLVDVGRLIVDRSSRMNGKAFPRLSLRNRDGGEITGIVCMDGLEPFDTALGGLKELPAIEPAADKPAPSPSEPVAPAAAPEADRLRQALDEAWTAELRFETVAVRQVWRGRIEALKPAMGFLNIIQTNFHLHAKDGAIAAWRELGAERFLALGPDGAASALTLEKSRPDARL